MKRSGSERGVGELSLAAKKGTSHLPIRFAGFAAIDQQG